MLRISLWTAGVALALALVGNRHNESVATGIEADASWSLSTKTWAAGAQVEVQAAGLAGGGASLWIGARHLSGVHQLERDRVVVVVPPDLPPGTHELRVLLPTGRLLSAKKIEVRGGAGLQVRPVDDGGPQAGRHDSPESVK